jgi:hypothetical protein
MAATVLERRGTMTTTATWAAPRVGYLLTAAMAGRRYAEAAGMWRELDEPAQSDVITALAAQARLAVAEAGVPLQVDFSGLADAHCPEAHCPEARIAATSAYEGTGPWQPPNCLHCRELVASALAEIQLQAEVAAGTPASYVDLICQGKAVNGAA